MIRPIELVLGLHGWAGPLAKCKGTWSHEQKSTELPTTHNGYSDGYTGAPHLTLTRFRRFEWEEVILAVWFPVILLNWTIGNHSVNERLSRLLGLYFRARTQLHCSFAMLKPLFICMTANCITLLTANPVFHLCKNNCNSILFCFVLF